MEDKATLCGSIAHHVRGFVPTAVVSHPYLIFVGVAIGRRGTINSDEFKAYFLGKFPDKAEHLASFDWDAW